MNHGHNQREYLLLGSEGERGIGEWELDLRVNTLWKIMGEDALKK